MFAEDHVEQRQTFVLWFLRVSGQFFSLRREKPPIPVIRAEELGSAGRPSSTRRATADEALALPLPQCTLH